MRRVAEKIAALFLILVPLALALTVLTLTGHPNVASAIGAGAGFTVFILGCLLGGIELLIRGK